jgi:hypothetical protein
MGGMGHIGWAALRPAIGAWRRWFPCEIRGNCRVKLKEKSLSKESTAQWGARARKWKAAPESLDKGRAQAYTDIGMLRKAVRWRRMCTIERHEGRIPLQIFCETATVRQITYENANYRGWLILMERKPLNCQVIVPKQDLKYQTVPLGYLTICNRKILRFLLQ